MAECPSRAGSLAPYRLEGESADTMAIEINTDTIADAVVARLTDSGVLIPCLLTLDQAATYLGLTKEALKAKVHIGKVPTVEIDKKLRFDRHDLDRIIDDNKRVG
jgi:excisionase family DNA binding protein